MQGVTVTNGTVKYERCARPADFESKTPLVSLSYTVAEGLDPELATQYVMGIALRTVEAVQATPNAALRAVQVPQSRPTPPQTPPASTTDAPSEPGSVGASGSVSNKGALVQDDEPVATGATGAPRPDTQGGVVPIRRTRRTKAQMEADNMAKSGLVQEPEEHDDLLGPDPSAKPPLKFEYVYKVAAEAASRLNALGKQNTDLHTAIKDAGSATGKLAGIPEANWAQFIEAAGKLGN